MPPLLSVLATAVQARETALTLIETLAAIFSFLPLHSRVTCATVCRAWRTALRERRAWTRRLELDASSTDAALRAAALRAEGLLEALDVAGSPHITPAALLSVVDANSAALRELRGVGCCFAENNIWMCNNTKVATDGAGAAGRRAATASAGRVGGVQG
jgi:hypothetical protein